MDSIAILLPILVLTGVACDDELPCVPHLETECSPLYPPEFHEVYTNTLKPRCGLPGNGCHGPDGKKEGLVFANEDTAYALLLGKQGDRVRVDPKHAACSILLERIEAEDDSDVMPPGQRLSAAERCAITQWVVNGAKR